MDISSFRTVKIFKTVNLRWALAIGLLFLALVVVMEPVAFAQAQDAPAAAEAAAADAPAKEQTLLGWLYSSLGLEYLGIFLALSCALVALVIMNLISARRSSLCPPELIEGFEAHLDNKEYQEAYELSKTDESFLGNVLAAGLARLSSSYSHAIAAMQEVGAEENMKLDHRLSYLALIGTLSPMIGLFGTVHGMINSFYEIAAGGGTPDPNKLASGISTALLTTCLLYTSPSPRDKRQSRMPSSA